MRCFGGKYFLLHIKDTLVHTKNICSVVKSDVRVRFAPSPTGNLHLGGLRTAFYNYLFARKNRGKFILRIEDTDQKRIQPGSLENLQEMLHWVGIIPDEGPAVGGSYGPYIQSQRLDKYQLKAKELLEAGLAYRCFCSEIRLGVLKRDARKNQLNHGYDNKCRHLSFTEIDELLAKKQPFTIRFKIPDEAITFDDVIFGSHTQNVSEHEGDFVIIKSDGFPTYHFACVVDDHSMRISHVLRGAEWLPSTPKHIMMHLAFQWEPPQFAHLPLLVNRDRTKLSKRQASFGIHHLKSSKYEPLALLNFLSGYGCGFKSRETHAEIFDLPELCDRFTLSDVSRASCYMDMSQLEVYNQRYIVRELTNELSSKKVISQFRSFLSEQLGDRYESEAKHLPDEYVMRILSLYKERITNLRDLVQLDMKYLWTSPDIDEVTSNLQNFKVSLSEAVDVAERVAKAISIFEEPDFQQEKLVPVVKESSESSGLKHVIFMRCMRILLTGSKDGPGVAEILSMLGKEQSLRKLRFVSSELRTRDLRLLHQGN